MPKVLATQGAEEGGGSLELQSSRMVYGQNSERHTIQKLHSLLGDTDTKYANSYNFKCRSFGRQEEHSDSQSSLCEVPKAEEHRYLRARRK